MKINEDQWNAEEMIEDPWKSMEINEHQLNGTENHWTSKKIDEQHGRSMEIKGKQS